MLTLKKRGKNKRDVAKVCPLLSFGFCKKMKAEDDEICEIDIRDKESNKSNKHNISNKSNESHNCADSADSDDFNESQYRTAIPILPPILPLISKPNFPKSLYVDPYLQYKGLAMWSCFISIEEERRYIEFLDSCPWQPEYNRRTQCFGKLYSYSSNSSYSRNISSSYPFPPIFHPLADRLVQMGIFSPDNIPVSLVCNEYVGKQRIGAHVDRGYSGRVIAGISLGDLVI